MFATRDLALYASIVGTLSGLWLLYRDVFLDRARVAVKVSESWLYVGGVRTRPVLQVRVANRGRRQVRIEHVAQAGGVQFSAFFDFMQQIPVVLPEGHGHTFTNGLQGGYSFGQIPLKRFFVQDGAGRVHPLRERYRQRLENVLYRRALMWWRHRRD